MRQEPIPETSTSAISCGSRLNSLVRSRLGYSYMGDSSQFIAPAAEVAQEFERDGRSYLATIARGFAALGEGGPSAINTYDSQVFTFERIIEICERHVFMFAKAQVRAIAIRTGRGLGSRRHRHESQDANERLGNTIAQRLDPHVAAIASYLHHGRPGFTPNPSIDLQEALRRSPANLSGQIAVLLQLHAQRIASKRESDPALYRRNAEPAITRRLPNKILHFIRAKGRYQFDYGAAQSIIPCLRPGENWASTPTAPSGIYLNYESESSGRPLFFHFGQVGTTVSSSDSGGRAISDATEPSI